MMTAGVMGWARENLFNAWYNGVLTIVLGLLTLLALWFGLAWVFGAADWEVIAKIGGRFVIGQYNTEAACAGQNCFWRPLAGLMLVTMLLGMAWGVAGGGFTKRVAIAVTAVAALAAFVPYSFDVMGLDVRALLLANIPSLLAGLALARYTPLGTIKWVAVLSVGAFLLTLLLLQGFKLVKGIAVQYKSKACSSLILALL